jgi:hypothetical protein
VTFKSSEYSEDRGGAEVIDVEDYLDCVIEARRLSGDSEEIVDVGKYLACVDDARHLVGDGHEEARHGAQEPRPRLSSRGETLSMALLRFCGKHGIEKEGWGTHE